jgi:hypothetical protein
MSSISLIGDDSNAERRNLPAARSFPAATPLARSHSFGVGAAHLCSSATNSLRSEVVGAARPGR